MPSRLTVQQILAPVHMNNKYDHIMSVLVGVCLVYWLRGFGGLMGVGLVWVSWCLFVLPS